MTQFNHNIIPAEVVKDLVRSVTTGNPLNEEEWDVIAHFRRNVDGTWQGIAHGGEATDVQVVIVVTRIVT
jgi:hypothetical protein